MYTYSHACLSRYVHKYIHAYSNMPDTDILSVRHSYLFAYKHTLHHYMHTYVSSVFLNYWISRFTDFYFSGIYLYLEIPDTWKLKNTETMYAIGHTYVCMYVCLYVADMYDIMSVYVFMYICMCVCIYVCKYISPWGTVVVGRSTQSQY